MADTLIIKDLLMTKDNDGNEVGLHPETSDDQVLGLDKYAKRIDCIDNVVTITNGDGTTYSFTIDTLSSGVTQLVCEDHTITVINSDDSTYELEISNEVISGEDMLELWEIEDSRTKYY